MINFINILAKVNAYSFLLELKHIWYFGQNSLQDVKSPYQPIFSEFEHSMHLVCSIAGAQRN